MTLKLRNIVAGFIIKIWKTKRPLGGGRFRIEPLARSMN